MIEMVILQTLFGVSSYEIGKSVNLNILVFIVPNGGWSDYIGYKVVYFVFSILIQICFYNLTNSAPSPNSPSSLFVELSHYQH